MGNSDQTIVPEYSLDRDCTTLSRRVLQQFSSFTTEAQDVSAIMSRIALAAKLVTRRLSRAGLMAGALGFTGETNVQGESVKKMDISIFVQIIINSSPGIVFNSLNILFNPLSIELICLFIFSVK